RSARTAADRTRTLFRYGPARLGRADHDHRGRTAGRGAPDRHHAVARLAQGRSARSGPARASPRAVRECRRILGALAGAERSRAAPRGATPPPAARHGLACTGGDDPGGCPVRRSSLLIALTLLTAVLASGTAAGQAVTPRVAALRAAVVAPQLQS